MPLGPSYVDITWVRMANVYYELGPLRILTDGYITRIPRSAFYGGGGGLAYTLQPFTPDVDAVRRVMDALCALSQDDPVSGRQDRGRTKADKARRTRR